MEQRKLKSPHEGNSCVFLLTSAICLRRFRGLSLGGKGLDFLSFFDLILAKMKRGIYFSSEETLVHAAVSLLPFIGGLGGVNTEVCVVCWAMSLPVSGLVELHPLGRTEYLSGCVIFTHWARLGSIYCRQRGTGLQNGF